MLRSASLARARAVVEAQQAGEIPCFLDALGVAAHAVELSALSRAALILR